MSLVSIIYTSILIFTILLFIIFGSSYFYNFFQRRSQEKEDINPVQKINVANLNFQNGRIIRFPKAGLTTRKSNDINRVTLITNLEVKKDEKRKSGKTERFSKIDDLKLTINNQR